MRRFALLTTATVLALPAAAGAATFPARVVQASARALTVRLTDGAIVRYAGPRVASAPARPQSLAHAAREAAGGALALNLRALDPGVTVLVTARRGSTTGATIALPGPGAPEQHASGVVSGLRSDGFVLELPDRTALRLHARVQVRACESAEVAYHQDDGLLVADVVNRGRAAAGHCATRTATGNITAISASGLLIGHRVFEASPDTIAGFRVGDLVEVSYTPGAMIARQVEYVQRVARGTVTAAGDGSTTIATGATGRPETFSTGARIAAGAHVVIVYHRSAGALVADVVYAFAS